ncbi:hypothetical protein SP21_28 [Salmonella phage 21]|nr:hypothetical protein SP21_28 [Salmonella phage 21]
MVFIEHKIPSQIFNKAAIDLEMATGQNQKRFNGTMADAANAHEAVSKLTSSYLSDIECTKGTW